MSLPGILADDVFHAALLASPPWVGDWPCDDAKSSIGNAPKLVLSPYTDQGAVFDTFGPAVNTLGRVLSQVPIRSTGHLLLH